MELFVKKTPFPRCWRLFGQVWTVAFSAQTSWPSLARRGLRLMSYCVRCFVEKHRAKSWWSHKTYLKTGSGLRCVLKLVAFLATDVAAKQPSQRCLRPSGNELQGSMQLSQSYTNRCNWCITSYHMRSYCMVLYGIVIFLIILFKSVCSAWSVVLCYHCRPVATLFPSQLWAAWQRPPLAWWNWSHSSRIVHPLYVQKKVTLIVSQQRPFL